MERFFCQARFASIVVACSLLFISRAFALITPANGMIVAGNRFSLALKSDGTVWAWGANERGQLGDGTTTGRRTPVPMVGVAGVAAISSGGFSTLLLKTDGTVLAVGANEVGQLGDGTTLDRLTPVSVAGLSGIVAISAGYDHALALRSDGTVWVWGANATGQLGDGTTAQRPAPVQISGLVGVTALAAGQGHSLALMSDGSIRAWGANDHGQLGDGTTTQRLAAVQVSGASGITAISARYGFSLALSADGKVWSWGYNQFGMLGDGTTTDRAVPMQIGGLSGISAISAGYAHALAIAADGALWGWGTITPWTTAGGAQVGTTYLSPVAMNGLTGVSAVSVGAEYSMVVKADGTVWSWGWNFGGELGNGAADSISPLPLPVTRLTGVVSLAISNYHAAVVRVDGTVWTWGTSVLGALGDGTQDVGPVAPAPLAGISGVRTVVSAYDHTIAVKNDGTLWGWGKNSQGQLGIGLLTAQQTSPVQATGMSGVISAATGGFHTIALKGDGTVWSTGWNTNGQLGDGTTTNRSTFVQVSGLAGIVKIAAGRQHNLAIKSDGTVWAWGYNYRGQIGDGTTTNRLVPVQVAGLTGVVAISAGGSHSAAVLSDGSVRTWGNNTAGELGDGTTTMRKTPVAVPGIEGGVDVETGFYATFARKADGTIWGWRANPSGFLGDGTENIANAPVRALVNGVTSLAASDMCVIALLSDGTLRGWGADDWGILASAVVMRLTPVAIRLTVSAVDTNQNGMSDAWEMQYFGNLAHAGTADTDGDGLTDVQEFAYGTDPTKADADGDLLTDYVDLYPNDYYNNVAPTLTIIGGNNQTTAAGQFNSLAFDVGTWSSAGTVPLVNAPVTFTVQSGGGQLATTNTGSPTLSGTLNLRTDIDGTVQAFFKQPAAGGVQSQVQVTAGTAQLTLTSTSQSTGDADGNGLLDSWEIQYFGHTGVDPNADPDGDGLTNAQELTAGSNPLDNTNGRSFTLDSPSAVAANAVSYTYDQSGRLVSAGYGGTNAQQFTHDAATNLTSVASIQPAIFAWRSANNLPVDGTGNGADNAILANDGLPNLAKYAFGLDPHVAVTSDQPSISLTNVSGSDYLTLTFRRPDAAPADLIYKVEVSTNGTTWTSSSGVTVDVSNTVSNSIATVVVRDATAIGAPNFGRRIRLSVERRALP